MSDLNLTIDKNKTNEIKCHTPIFDLVEKDGIVKLHAPDWVNVAVYNRDSDEWIMAKEYRHGIDEETQEFMSGTVEEGETAKAAAIRELKEELGYDFLNIVRIEELFEENVNPAFMDNKVTGFYIEVEGEPGNTKFDEGENVKIVKEYECPIFHYNGLISKFTFCRLRLTGLYK